MLTRPSPFSVTPTVAFPPTTSEELLTALVATGGRVLARQAHGVLVDVRKHLVFVPPTGWVPDATLADALRAAGLTTERFLELRGASR